jgi:hypothetical protein
MVSAAGGRGVSGSRSPRKIPALAASKKEKAARMEIVHVALVGRGSSFDRML